MARDRAGDAAPPEADQAVAALNEAGIATGVLMAPILPGISDHPDQLRAVAAAAIEAGATHVSPILLHLRPGVREEFMPWLAEAYPDLVERYEEMYRKPYASPEDRKALGRTVGGIIDDLGGVRAGTRPDRWGRKAGPGPEPSEQLSLL
jgi:DNA repair photolyase